MTNLEIGERIRKTRIQKGLTLDDVAKEIGLTKSTIGRYETGKINDLKLPVITAIANVLGVNDAWLLGKDDRMVLSDAERFARFAEQYNATHFQEDKPEYYLNEELADLAREMFKDKDMRILYSMKRNMNPEVFRDHMDYIKKLYLREHPEAGDDFDGC